MTSAQAPGGAFVLGHSAAALPPPLAPGQQTQNVLAHPWLARAGRDGRMPLYGERHESSNSCFLFSLAHSLMVFLFLLTATETYSQGKGSLACDTLSGETSL